ncbi:cytochrome c1 [Lichenicola sp.]|uniref:cytochrome c1 n=1 Tax=Lichenicola sp. TaxID=2804529 RepID=UPI003AFFD972
MRRLIAAAVVVSGAVPALSSAADFASVQRGYAVYAQVCSACHSLKQVTYADLGDLGLTSAQLKALATGATVTDGTDANGQPIHRAGRPDDHLPSPFPNEAAARVANNGALPPDMSRLALTLDGHQRYIERLLTSYQKAPAGFEVPPGSYYNTAAPGRLIAMPPPLHDGQVAFTDNTRPNTGQMAHDVAAFLGWVAHPHLEQRRRVGVSVVLYVALLTLLLFFLKRRIWTHVD